MQRLWKSDAMIESPWLDRLFWICMALLAIAILAQIMFPSDPPGKSRT